MTWQSNPPFSKIQQTNILSIKTTFLLALNGWSYKQNITVVFNVNPILTLMISTISFFSIVPFPSISYIANAQFNFCDGLPPDVILIASRNSLKSILPLLSLSNDLNTCSQNWLGFPAGKNVEYTSKNLVFDSKPSGQSLWKTKIYHFHFEDSTENYPNFV